LTGLAILSYGNGFNYQGNCEGVIACGSYRMVNVDISDFYFVVFNWACLVWGFYNEVLQSNKEKT
jgi:hypothetical protein